MDTKMINHPNRKKVKATANSAAITEHKERIRESNRLEAAMLAARDKEEKSMGRGRWRQNEGSGRVKRSFPRFTIDGTVPAVPSARWPFAWPELFR
jgi:hypothetical protein